MSQRYSRREIIQRIGAAGAAALGVALAVACDSGAKEAAGPKPAAPKPAPKPAAPAAPAAPQASAGGALSCSDVSGLSEADKTMRQTTLQYVEKSADPAKLCSNCQLYVAPPEPGKCGTCTLVKGPINPDGSCMSWVAKAG